VDLLDDQGANASSMSVAETFVPSPSPRRNTQSPETHQLQQTLRNSTSELVRTFSSSSDSGDGASAFASLQVSNALAVVETVQEGGSDDEEEWPEVNLGPRLSDAHNGASLMHDSGLQQLIINAEDPGRADFAMNVGALGNASGIPLDGAQNMSFSKSTVDGGHTIDGDAGNEGVRSSYNTTSGQDPSDPEVIAALMTQRAVADPRSPSAMRFNEQVTVAECSPNHSPNALQTLSTAASTSIGNLGDANAAGSMQGDPTSSQGDPSSSQPDTNASAGGDPNSNNSNRSEGNQGGSSTNNDPQGHGPDGNYLDMLVFTCSATGGPLQHWGIKGMIKVADVVQFTPDASAQNPNQLSLNSVRHLVRPDIVNRVTNDVHFRYQHNDRLRVQAIINDMSIFVLTAPNTRIALGNVAMLEDHVWSSKEMCHILVGHLLHAETLSPDQLPLEVPIILYGERMQTHPYAITGSFAYVKKVNDANVIVIPCGRNANRVPIANPVIVQPPALPPIPVAPPPIQPPVPGGAPPSAAPVVGNVPDPIAALIQGVLAAIQAMTQMNIEWDLRNASMTQQQSSLQVATMQANQLQLQHLTNHLGNLGPFVAEEEQE